MFNEGDLEVSQLSKVQRAVAGTIMQAADHCEVQWPDVRADTSIVRPLSNGSG